MTPSTSGAPEGAPPRVRRDQLTLTLYGTFVMWGWFLYSFSPSVPLLTEDLGISRAQGGLHGTALAVGAVVAAILTPRLVLRLGRRSTLMLGGFVVAAGVVLLLLGPSILFTLSGMLVLAVGANIAVASAQVALALHHRGGASAIITEANGVGSSIGLLGPLAVGATVAAGWGWRPAVAVTIPLALLTALLALRVKLPSRVTTPEIVEGPAPVPPAPTPSPAPVDPQRRLPVRFGRLRPQALASWCFLTAILAGIGLENVTTYWSAELVIGRTGAPASIATATTAGLVAGMSLIRFVIAPLSLRIRPAHLLTFSFLVSVVGWAVLWTATVPAIALVGLFVAGLGYGAQYPLGISLLLRVAGAAVDKAQARSTLAGGLAIGVLPFALGALADAFGPHRAFLLVPAIAVLGAVAAVAGARATRGERA